MTVYQTAAIYDVIKQNESEVAKQVFEIWSKIGAWDENMEIDFLPESIREISPL